MIQMLPPLHSLFLVMTAFALTFTKHQSVTQVPLTFTKHQGVLHIAWITRMEVEYSPLEKLCHQK